MIKVSNTEIQTGIELVWAVEAALTPADGSAPDIDDVRAKQRAFHDFLSATFSLHGGTFVRPTDTAAAYHAALSASSGVVYLTAGGGGKDAPAPTPSPTPSATPSTAPDESAAETPEV